MHTNTGRQTRQKLREPLQRAQRLYFFILAHTQKDDVESNGGSLENVAEVFVLLSYRALSFSSNP